ncbi:MAG: IS21-like element helper ATPase IstB [Lysobacterales bacterium]
MLQHPTLDKLKQLKFTGMARALKEQIDSPDIDAMDFHERLGLLVDREITERDNRRLSSRLRQAKLKHLACVEDIDYRHPRGLDRSQVMTLSSNYWLSQHRNVLITGPTGIGKTWIACALAQKACREGYRALYLRLPRLLQQLPIAKGDGTYPKLLMKLAKVDLIILDDWGLSKLTAEQRRDLLEILEDRYDTRSTLVTSQLPVDQWHGVIADATLADAILDRLVHNAYRINLKGESLRKTTAKLTGDNETE